MKEILVKTQHNTYPVCIGDIDKIVHKGKVLIVSNPKISGLFLKNVLEKIQADEVFISIIPDGEEHKNFQNIQRILDVAFESKLDRKSLMIALGGGVISDMVGFASGIYQRGIDFISIPTTLLSQVDASVGGKTGINNKFGKNLIGVFHQPKAVYINTSFLSTLAERDFNAGIAEIIKMAVCFDKGFFDFIEQNNIKQSDNLEYAIQKSVEIKARIVELDEKEQGIRAALNYGHTFGHVIENLSNYSSYLHGEAVAIGMKMANALAFRIGYISLLEFERINLLLNHYNLNFDYKIDNAEKFYEKFFADKKTIHKKINFILPKGIGDVVINNDISKSEIMGVLKQWEV